MTVSASGWKISSFGVFSTGPSPVLCAAGSRADAASAGLSFWNGAIEQPEIASRNEMARRRRTAQAYRATPIQGNPGSLVPGSSPGIASVSSGASGGRSAPGGQASLDWSGVPGRNGMLTADPLQYGEVSRPEK